MKKFNSYLIGVSVSFIVVVCLFVSLVLSLFFSMKSYSTQLENAYKTSLYQLVQNIDDLQVDMSKLMATASSETQRELLINMRTSCTLAVNNLNTLPISSSKTSNLNNFFNMLSGYSQSLIEKINSNKKLGEGEFENIENLFNKSTILLFDINKFISSANYNYSILSEVKVSNEMDSSFSAGIANGDNPESDMPTLIYDGPFAESVTAKEIKGLSNNYLTYDECLSKAQELLGYFEGYELEFVGETNGKFETFNYYLKKDKNKIYVQLTKRDGLLLNITSYGKAEGDNISLDESKSVALQCAAEFGFEDLEVVWASENGNIVYVNLAPVIDGVIYYPDLIKVKVNKSIGVIVGWDAVNYAYNHVSRGDFESNFGIVEGESKLNPMLEVTEMKKCVIPNKYSGESFAYEYVCKWNDYTYYVYLSSLDFSELNIMRIISTNSGNLLQ